MKLSASKSKLAFNVKTIHAKKGSVTLRDGQPLGPAARHRGQGPRPDPSGKTVNKGGTSRVTVTLKKGTYTFYCPVDGHAAAGMKGKLVAAEPRHRVARRRRAPRRPDGRWSESII